MSLGVLRAGRPLGLVSVAWLTWIEMSVQGKTAASDFSIERILSDAPRSPRPEDAPSWLCCTRYRPPRLPRAAVGAVSRARRAGRHARVPFTAAQAQALEAAYSRAPYLAPPALRALAAALQLRDDRIKIWFQNRRARERREKCSTITPPHGVTLTPTCVPMLRARVHSIDYQGDPSLGDHGDIDRMYPREDRGDLCASEACRDHIPGGETGRPDTPLDIESVED